MNRDLDIIFFALPRWDGNYSSTSYSLAKEFSKNNRVFYIDNPFTVKDFITQNRSPKIQTRKSALIFGKNIYKKVNGLSDNFIAVTPPLTIPNNFLPSGYVYEALSSANDKLIFMTISRIIKDYDVKKYIFINSFNPFYVRQLPEKIRPLLKIYQTVDDIAQSGYTSKHGPRLEKKAVASADLTLATSQQLTKLMKAYSSEVHYLPNAADVELFKTAAFTKLDQPNELEGNEKKVIGYVGNLDRLRVDYLLLKKIAEFHSDKILLLVGPSKYETYKDFGLDKYPNVIITGGKKLEELPGYLQNINCAIIPFVCNELTKSIYPLKVNEYLATGTPVVSSRFSDDINDCRDAAYLADSHEDFLNKIEEAIKTDNEENRKSRIQFAEKNTWSARVKSFWEIVDPYIESK
jgi:teichuronic acid biosynthesis glycosyltransferase TuaH